MNTSLPSSACVICSSHRLRRGFTLLELIVVVAIVAVLAAFLLPVVGRVQSSADSASAVNSMRQLGVAFIQVAAENNQTLPIGYDSTRNPSDWVRRITGPEFGRTISLDAWKNLFKNSVATRKDKYKPSSGIYGFLDSTPYGMNVYLQNTSLAAVPPPWINDPPHTWKLQAVPKPSSTVVLGDGWINPGFLGAGSRIQYLKSLNSNESVSYRHPGGRAAFLFADWHIELATHAEVRARPEWFDHTKQ